MGYFIKMPRKAIDIEQEYQQLLNTMDALAILAENAQQTYPEGDLGSELAKLSLKLVDQVSQMHDWVSKGGPLPGQVKEVEYTATAMIHVANILDIINGGISDERPN